eukprot:1668850-Karenia_brevis.AAC.1
MDRFQISSTACNGFGKPTTNTLQQYMDASDTLMDFSLVATGCQHYCNRKSHHQWVVQND